jgi:hypothetical protein
MKTKPEILAKIQQLGFPDNEVAIELDDFFDNNNSNDSIGVNIYPNPPSAEKFYQVFKNLIVSGKADNVYVRISDIEEPTEWFFSDTIYVIGALSLDELKNHINMLRPDEIYENWMYGKPINIENISNDKKVYSIFWD